MKSTTLELASDAYTLVTINEHKKFVFKFNQVFLDRNPLQSKALLQPHQMRAFSVMVDDCSRSHLGPSNKPGGQCIIVIIYNMLCILMVGNTFPDTKANKQRLEEIPNC